MATPNYKGANQPSANGSGWLGSWLGGTPAYKSAQKLASSDAVGVTSVDSETCGPAPFAIVIPREVVEQQ